MATTIIDHNRLCPACMHLSAAAERVCPRCGADRNAVRNNETQLQVGTLLNGRYYIGRVLGQGGFGITYCACDLSTGVKRAVKEYFPQNCVSRLGTSQGAVIPYSGEAETFFQSGLARFYQEAKSLARFANLNCVIGVRDYFRANGTAYIVMDFAEGQDLKVLTKKRGRLNFNEVLAMMRPLMADLCVIHEQHLIHRDIKPDNIMISPEGKAVLIDFGAARESGGTSTKLGVIHDYAPLEQHQNTTQGPWTDVYAMCALLYQQATGRMVPHALQRLLEKKQLVKPSALGVKLPKNVENALVKGLALHAKDRTQSMRQLYNELYGKKKAGVPVGWIAGAAAALVLGIGLLAIGPLSGPVNEPVPTEAPQVTSPPSVQTEVIPDATATAAPTATPVPTAAPTPTPRPKAVEMSISQAVVAGGSLYVLDERDERVYRLNLSGETQEQVDTQGRVWELRQGDGVVYGMNTDGLLWIAEDSTQDEAGDYFYASDINQNYPYLTDARMSGEAVMVLLGYYDPEEFVDPPVYVAELTNGNTKEISYGTGNASFWLKDEKNDKQNCPVFEQNNNRALGNISAIALHDEFGVGVVKGELWYWGTPPSGLAQAMGLDKPSVAKRWGSLGNIRLDGNDVTETDDFAGFDVLSVGSQTLAAISQSGDVYMAGLNDDGQLGWDEEDKGNGKMKKVALPDLNGEKPQEVFCMEGYTLMLTDGGTLYGWGNVPGHGQMTPGVVYRNVADFSPSESTLQVLVTRSGEVVLFGGGENFRTLIQSNGG